MNPIALVEAPKTAIYGTLYFGLPESSKNIIWLAVYNKSSFSIDKMEVLKGRNVFVFPDLSKDGNTFKEWEAKAKEYEKQLTGIRFIFSDLLEKLATEKDKIEGNDLADILIRQDWRLFRKEKQISEPQPEPKKLEADSIDKIETVEPIVRIFQYDKPKTNEKQPKKNESNWSKDIAELEQFYTNITLPPEPIQLNQCSRILDISTFLKANLEAVKANKGNRTFLPYLNRLKDLQQVLTVKY